MTRFPPLSNERNGEGRISATSCGDDLLSQRDATATGPESISSSLIHSSVPVSVSVLVPPSVPTPLSTPAPVTVPISASVLDATAITDDDINGDKSKSTSAHSIGEIPCNSEGEIPCKSEGTISLVEPMFR
jgi:hypothetical protein